ncbi:hypothetical protein NQ303_25965, partial [Escherichia coli]|nr:hypothetical protein [Escherichia coli]
MLKNQASSMITGIDLVVVEKSTGIVFLCQLKHQELYGADLHAKHVRTTRLKKQASDWLTSMNNWLNSITEIELRKSGNDSNLLIVFYVQIMPDDLVMQLHR